MDSAALLALVNTPDGLDLSVWKILKSLAFKGRRFETWQEIEKAVQKATAYWNAHRHPYVWGRRRRHRPHRKPGIARLPMAA